MCAAASWWFATTCPTPRRWGRFWLFSSLSAGAAGCMHSSSRPGLQPSSLAPLPCICTHTQQQRPPLAAHSAWAFPPFRYPRLPHRLQSYIQSRGRARMANSELLLMVQQGVEEQEEASGHWLAVNCRGCKGGAGCAGTRSTLARQGSAPTQPQPLAAPHVPTHPTPTPPALPPSSATPLPGPDGGAHAQLRGPAAPGGAAQHRAPAGRAPRPPPLLLLLVLVCAKHLRTRLGRGAHHAAWSRGAAPYPCQLNRCGPAPELLMRHRAASHCRLARSISKT